MNQQKKIYLNLWVEDFLYNIKKNIQLLENAFHITTDIFSILL